MSRCPRHGGGERGRTADPQRRPHTRGDLAKQRKELAERARANRSQPADITGATFTISNLGHVHGTRSRRSSCPRRRVSSRSARLRIAVVAVDGMIGVRPTVLLTFRHHVSLTARVAAAFLTDVVIACRNEQMAYDAVYHSTRTRRSRVTEKNIWDASGRFGSLARKD